MIRQGLTVRVLCGLVLCGLMTGCSDSSSPTGPTGGPTSPSSPQVIDRTFTLAPGEAASVHDGALQLRFQRVVRDNRCPGDALCITAGEAILEFDRYLKQGNSARETKIQMSTSPPGSTHLTGDIYTIQLEALTPYPFASLPPIQPDNFRATVRITSK
jgi:hypothetical protein